MKNYTPTSLTAAVKRLVDRHFVRVAVEGEIGQIHAPASGHMYFNLRDRDAVVWGVMFRSERQQLRFEPKEGERVLCRGKLSVYGPRGRYQLHTHLMERAGAGALARELQKRRLRLEEAGLLDPRRKRDLPRTPRIVGVATSPTGAALQDFIETARRRSPATRILVSPCYVQGDQAPPSVIRAVELLVEDGRSEVIVVTRGGGAKEDLLAFWDEQLARYLAHCPIPVVTAVGHEVDDTLVDLVADAVAATPTAAATLAIPDGRVLAQRADEVSRRLQSAMAQILRRHREQLTGLRARLRSPVERITRVRERRDALEQRLHRAMAALLQERQHRLSTARAGLDALSPFAVLERGYAIVQGHGGVVSAPDQVAAGDPLSVRLSGGTLEVTVSDPPSKDTDSSC